MSVRKDKAARGKRGLSLRFEVATLADAIEAARRLGEFAQHGHCDSLKDEISAHAGADAVLALVVLRMRQLDAVLAGDADAATLAAPHNRIDLQQSADDIVLPLRKRRR